MPRSVIVLAAAAVAVVLALNAGGARVASAHPLGNFTINHYDQIDLSAEGIAVSSVLDMAEIPAFQERGIVDANGDGVVDDGERAAYAQSKATELMQSLVLDIDGRRAELRLQRSDVSFPPGQAGLSLLRLTAAFVVALPDGWRASPPKVSFTDSYYGDRLGWREIVVRGGSGAAPQNSSAPTTSATAELTQYPTDALSSPLDVRSATFSIVPAASTSDAPVESPAPAATTRAITGNTDSPLARFAGLIAKDHLSAGVIIVALLAAMGFGAVHALSPGHGKTVVAAYLVGSRGTMRHALLLGVTVTLTHTASVYALGFATLYLSEFIVPERLYPWLGVASGGLIVLMGLSLLCGRLRASGLAGQALRWLRQHVARGRRTRLAVAAGEAGAVVLPGHSHSDDGGHHQHEHSGHEHSYGLGRPHSHAIPGQDGEPVTWRQLVGLGIFGGMLPCPSAIVVMLSAISLHRVGFGLILIVAFSLGLAGVLTGIGFVLVLAKRLSSRVQLFDRIAKRATQSGGATSLIVRLFPSASAAAVIGAGAVILLRALMQQGLI